MNDEKKARKKEILEKIKVEEIEEFDDAIKAAMDLEEILDRKNREIACLKDEIENIRIKNKEERRQEEKLNKLAQLVKDKNKEIDNLRQKIKQIRDYNKEQQRKINRLEGINKLDELQAIEEKDVSEIDFSDDKERKEVANKFRHLAKLIEENNHLDKNTLETFDFYREQFVDRCIKEKDLGDQVDNL